MTDAAERAQQLALVSRLKTIFPEVPEWPTPDMVTHDHYLAYMKTSHDVGGELDYPHPYENKEEEQWELMTYVLCEVLGWRGIWVSEERRRLANVDVGRAIYLGLPYYSRWLWSVGRLLIEKKHISWGELTDRLAEVQARYAGGLNGQRPEAKPKFEGDGSGVSRNKHHLEAVGIGDPAMLRRSGRRGEVQRGRQGEGAGTACDVLHQDPRVLPRRRGHDRRGDLRKPGPRGRDLGPGGRQAGMVLHRPVQPGCSCGTTTPVPRPTPCRPRSRSAGWRPSAESTQYPIRSQD